MAKTATSPLPKTLSIFGESEMATRVIEYDWASTPLGPLESWPQNLMTAVNICLNSSFPMFVRWGDDLINIYNDAYVPMLGRKHPQALGKPTRETWAEVWDFLQPQYDMVLKQGKATWNERMPLVLERKGYPEDVWFTWSYSPIKDENGAVVAIFGACTEDTAYVLAEKERDQLLEVQRVARKREEEARITLMKASELNQSQKFLRAIIDTVMDPIFVKDRNHRWIEGNTAFWDLLGGEEKAKGKTDFDFFPEDQAKHFWEGDDRVFAGERFNEEEKLLKPDGTEMTIATKKVAFTLKNGEVGLVGVIRDVTHERKIETEIRQHRDHLAEVVDEKTVDIDRLRRLYETILSSTPDFIYVFNINHTVNYANDALLRTWGTTAEEVVGKTFLDLGYEPWHAEMHNREIDTVVKTKKPIRGEVPFTGTQGRRIYDYIFVPVFNDKGDVEAVAGTTRDVTERKLAEDTLRKSEERQRLALEASHSHGIWDWDIVNNIFTADERFGALFGLTAEESHAGVPIERPIQAIHPDDLKQVEMAIEKVLKEGGRYSEEYRVVQPNGEIRWISARGHMQFDEEGRAVRFPGAGADITREREALDALKDANKRKDEFLATLAHELRNPLAPVRNSLYLFKSNSLDAGRRQQAYEVVERQIEQMVRLVDDLMDVSRINTGKIELRREAILLQDVIKNAVEVVQPLINEYKHKLVIDIPASPIYLDGDVVRLSQIFANLLNNAAKYTNPGGRISVEASIEDSYAVIKVSDNGIGINSETLPHIFDMFSQADSSIEKSRGGLGIGLTITKKLVDLHNGSIKVESDGVGYGSRFIVKLGITQLPISTEEEDLNQNDRSSSLSVLIVDDNQESAQTLGWAVEMYNCSAVTCNDGREAIEIAKKLKPHVVLLDIGMPGLNGYEICKLMKNLDGLQNTIFIAQTGWGQKEHRLRSEEAGFDYHLVKPIDLQVLKKILNETNE